MTWILWIAIGMLLAVGNYDPAALQKFSVPVVLGVVCIGLPIAFGVALLEGFKKLREPHLEEEDRGKNVIDIKSGDGD